MSVTDKQVRFIIIAFIVVYLSVLAIGIITNKLSIYLAFLNVISGSSIIVYWIQKQWRITQHIFEFREMAFLFIECVFIVFTVYYIATNYLNEWIKTLQYTIFGLHLVILLVLLFFMLTFKMKRLF